MHPSLSPGYAHDCVARRHVAFEDEVLAVLKAYGNGLQSEIVSVYCHFTEILSVYQLRRLPVNELLSEFLLKQEQEMANVFGATSTTEEVLSGVNLQGKRILVT